MRYTLLVIRGIVINVILLLTAIHTYAFNGPYKVTGCILPKPNTHDTVVCGSQFVSIIGKGSSTGRYRWYTQAIGGVAVDTDAIYNLYINSNDTLYLAATNGTCESARDTIIIRLQKKISINISIKSDTVCPGANDSIVALAFGADSIKAYRWYKGAINAVDSLGNTAGISVAPLVSTRYILRAISDSGCDVRDTVKIITRVMPPLTAASLPDSICNGSKALLKANLGSVSCNYCITHPNDTLCSSAFLIDSVVLGRLNFVSSGCRDLRRGYAHIYGITDQLVIGKTYTMKVYPTSGTTPYMHLAVWIDFNRDCSLNTDSSEQIYSAAGVKGDSTIINFTVPKTAVIGNARLRIKYFYYSKVPDSAIAWNKACDSILPAGVNHVYGEVLDFDVTLIPIGNTFTWLPATTPSSGATVKASPTVTTTYTITYTDNIGCKEQTNVTVNVRHDFTVHATPSNDSICYGSTDTLGATVTPSYFAVKYLWVKSNAYGYDTLGTLSKLAIQPYATYDYSVMATDKWGCSHTDKPSIFVLPLPKLNPVAVPDTICKGDSVNLYAYANTSCQYCSFRPNGFTNCYPAVLMDTIVLENLKLVNPGCKAHINNYYFFKNNKSKDFEIGKRYQIKIVPHNIYPNTHFAVWIDYNHDCSFTSSKDELVYSTQSAPDNKLVISFKIPEGAQPGLTRVRIIEAYYYQTHYIPLKYTDACDTGNIFNSNAYGEVAEFDINLQESASYAWPNNTIPSYGSVVKSAPAGTTYFTMNYASASKCRVIDSVQVAVSPQYTITVSPHIDTTCYGKTDSLKSSIYPTFFNYRAVWYADSLNTLPVDSNKIYLAKPLIQKKYYCRSVSTGCTRSDSTLITVIPLPVLKPVATPDTICKGDTTVLTAFVSPAVALNYCNATSMRCDTTFEINNISIAGINAKVGCHQPGPGFTKIKAIVPNLIVGDTYTLRVKINGSCKLAAWIDYFRSGLFTDPSELLFLTQNADTGNNYIKFRVPITAIPGLNKLRILMSDSHDSLTYYDGCDSTTDIIANPYYGMVADMDINIVAPLNFKWYPNTTPDNRDEVKAAPDTTMRFTVNYFGPGGCSSSNSVVVHVAPDYKTFLSPKNDTICARTTLTLKATSLPKGAKIKWLMPDYWNIYDFDSLYIFNPIVPEKYKVMYDLNGCHRIDSSNFSLVPFFKLSATATPASVCQGDTTLLNAYSNSSYDSLCPSYSVYGCNGYYIDSLNFNDTLIYGERHCNNTTHFSKLVDSLVVPHLTVGALNTLFLRFHQFSHWAAWIDNNHDGIFSGAEEVGFGEGELGPPYKATVLFKLPIDAAPGLTYLRVRFGSQLSSSSGYYTTGCDTSSGYYSETLDFPIYINSIGGAYTWSPVSAGISRPNNVTANARVIKKTEYYVTYKYGDICKFTDSVSVDINPADTPGIINGPVHVIKGSFNTYFISTKPSSKYVWHVKHGSIYSSINKDTVFIKWGGSGMDTIKVWTRNPCSDTSYLVVNVSTGINDLEPTDKVFDVFPNPAQNEFTIRLKGSIANRYSADLLDMSGKQIMHLLENDIQGTFKFDSRLLQDGLYIIVVKDNYGIMYNRKLTINK